METQGRRNRGCGGVTPPPNNLNVGQSWSKWNWYSLKVGQNGSDICLKFNSLLILVENF
jgi:hypothetical protein